MTTRLRAPAWAVLLLLWLCTAVFVAIAYSEQNRSGKQRSATAVVARLGRTIAEVDAAEWRAIAEGGRGSSVRELRAAQARAVAALNAAQANRDVHEPGLRAVSARYAAALDREIELLSRGRTHEARRVDRTRVDPIFNELHSALDRTAVAQVRRSHREGATAERATAVAAILGGIALLLLLAQLGLQRRLLRRERDHLEQLQSVDRLKDELVASVSHELRTPLTSIQGYLELVLEGEAGELTEEQREFLGIVDRNAGRLLHVVGDLLDVAQIESGRFSLDLQDGNLAAVVADSVDAARPAAADRRIDLNLETNGAGRVRVDRARFGQVVDNLLSNALKFTEPGGHVDVRVAAPNGYAVVEVADSGIGIPKEEQANLFQRFFRTEAAGEKAIQGTGLGLWISKAIVEAHGGEIAVDSEPGRGTTFRIELPFVKGAR